MRFTIASALLLVSAPAFAADVHQFTRDGETYSYSAERNTKGVVHLTGLSKTSNAPFDLVVRHNRVEGTMNGMPVDFRVSDETIASLDAETSAPVQTASTGSTGN